MGTVHQINQRLNGLAGGGNPPHDGDMQARLSKLEAIIPTLSTKADAAELRSDFHKSTNDLIKWIVGTAFVGIALFITIMTFVLNNAVPKSQPTPVPASQPAPIVITVPAQPSSQTPVKSP